MTIALITDGIWPFVIGGMQRHSYYLCKYLSREKINIRLYHTTRNNVQPDLSTCFSAEELKFIKGHYIAYPASDNLPGHYLRTSYKYSERIYRELLKASEVDIIYAKGLSGWKTIEQKKKGTRLPPIAINVHGYEYYQRAASLRSKLEQLMLRPAFRYINMHADYIFSYGANISSIIRKHIPKSSSRIIEIPASIEKEMLAAPPTSVNRVRQFVFVGRSERRKGIEELTEAIKILETTASFAFHFIGDISPNILKASPGYVFHGQLSDKLKMKEILSAADVLVCPSYAEGMPNVILEGMAGGCAIIATNVGAVPLQVELANGWLIQPGSVASLTNAIQKALKISDEELLEKKIRSFSKVQEQFLWDVNIAKLIESFQRIRAKENN